MFIQLLSSVYYKSALFLGHFLPAVFDTLQYANTQREGLGDLVTCVMSSRQTGGTQETVPNNGPWSIHKAVSAPVIVQGWVRHEIWSHTAPGLCLPVVMTKTKSLISSPSVLQAIKDLR